MIRSIGLILSRPRPARSSCSPIMSCNEPPSWPSRPPVMDGSGDQPWQPHPRRLYQYLRALENAGNALASLTGEPLTERRFLLKTAPTAADPYTKPISPPGWSSYLPAVALKSRTAWPELDASLEISLSNRWRARRYTRPAACLPASLIMRGQPRHCGKKTLPPQYGCSCAPGRWPPAICPMDAKNWQSGKLPSGSFISDSTHFRTPAGARSSTWIRLKKPWISGGAQMAFLA